MSELHLVTMYLCDTCLKRGDPGYGGCDDLRCAFHERAPLWDRFMVVLDGFSWEGCPTCHIADDGGWAVKLNVDVSKCIPCKGTGLVRVRAADRRPPEPPPPPVLSIPKCLCMTRCAWWDCPVHAPGGRK
jgi:hypothetical protein